MKELTNETVTRETSVTREIPQRMYKDLSFLIDSYIPLYEHQSTYNPNIPFRNLLYVAGLYSRLTHEQNLYGHRLVKIPTPQFVVFYNGVEKQPERSMLRLSDAYEKAGAEIGLELNVLMLNINPGYNQKLMHDCKTLRDYMHYVEKVRLYTKEMGLINAVERAINECIADDILAKFLRNYRAEVKSVSIYEYDEEKHMKQVREEGREEGKVEGIEQGKKLCSRVFKVIQIQSGITDEKLAEDCGISIEEVKEIRTSFGL